MLSFFTTKHYAMRTATLHPAYHREGKKTKLSIFMKKNYAVCLPETQKNRNFVKTNRKAFKNMTHT